MCKQVDKVKKSKKTWRLSPSRAQFMSTREKPITFQKKKKNFISGSDCLLVGYEFSQKNNQQETPQCMTT